MPLYEYRCSVCGHITADFRKISDRHNECTCESCRNPARLAVSQISPITDKRFFYTDKYDPRLRSHIKGRKDFFEKCKAKGLAEITKYDEPKTETIEERLKKNNTLITKEVLMGK